MEEIKDQYIYSMSAKNKPVLMTEPGTQVVFHTRDCFNNQIQSEKIDLAGMDWNNINPATGPLYIKGAEPGNILKVFIKKIELDDVGTMAAIPGDGVLGKNVTKSTIKRIPIKDRIATFAEKYEIPCIPMIGVIGVAPKDSDVPCGEPGNHGGNMDNTKIGEGATLYFPVMVEGALLSMGDVHANMGDGEIMVTGIEAAAKVTVEIDILKQKSIPMPYLETKDSIYVIASHQNIEEAVYDATLEMNRYVQWMTGLNFNDAGMLLSAVGNLQFCQVVDPKRTVRFEMMKKYLHK